MPNTGSNHSVLINVCRTWIAFIDGLDIIVELLVPIFRHPGRYWAKQGVGKMMMVLHTAEY